MQAAPGWCVWALYMLRVLWSADGTDRLRLAPPALCCRASRCRRGCRAGPSRTGWSAPSPVSRCRLARCCIFANTLPKGLLQRSWSAALERALSRIMLQTRQVLYSVTPCLRFHTRDLSQRALSQIMLQTPGAAFPMPHPRS